MNILHRIKAAVSGLSRQIRGTVDSDFVATSLENDRSLLTGMAFLIRDRRADAEHLARLEERIAKLEEEIARLKGEQGDR